MVEKLSQSKSQNIPKLRFPGFSGAWENCKIEKLVSEKIIDKPLDGNHGNIHPKSGDFVDEGIPFVMANDIKNGALDLEDVHKISKKQADSLQKGFSVAGDVLLTHKGNIGFTAIVPNISTEYIMLTPQVTYYRVLDRNRLSNYFLRYFFDADVFQKDIKILSGGGTRPYIGITEQRKMKIAFPIIEEQQKIAEFLGSVDEWIGNLRTQKESLESYKKGMMQKIFSAPGGQVPEIRFKDDDGNDFPEWEEKKLGEVSHINMGQSPESNSYNTAGIGMFLIQGNADIVGRKVYPRSWTTQTTKECKMGDIIMTVRAPVGYIAKTSHDACIGRGVCSIRNNKSSDIEFLYQYLLNYEEKWSKYSQGSTFTAVSSKDVRDLKIHIPFLSEQQKIAEFLTSLDNLIESKQQQITQTEQWKNGLMQGLFV